MIERYIKFDYYGFLMFDMKLSTYQECSLVEDTCYGQRAYQKDLLNDIGAFNFKYAVNRE